MSDTPKAMAEAGKIDLEARVHMAAAVSQCILAVAALISSTVLAMVVYQGQSLLTSRQINKSTRDSWITVDLAVLSSDPLLVTADNLMNPRHEGDAIEKRRKRWLGFAILNILVERYDAAEEGLIGPRDEVINALREPLIQILSDDDVYEITKDHGYEKRHKELFASARDEGLRRRASANPISPMAGVWDEKIDGARRYD